MPIQQISLLNTRDDGSLDALVSSEATKAIVTILASTYALNLEALNAKIFIENRIYYLSYELHTDHSQLITEDWLELLEQKLQAITKAIHKSPKNPKTSVFKEVGWSAQMHDKVVGNINDHRALFNALGFDAGRQGKEIQLRPIRDLIARQSRSKEYTCCIAAVCTYEAQPYATFFYYNGQDILQQYNGTFSRVEVNVPLADARKLDELRIAQRVSGEEMKVTIIVRETKSPGRKYDLISFQVLRKNYEIEMPKIV